MRIACLGYIDPEKWEAFSNEEQAQQIQECLRYDEQLRSGDHYAHGICLDGPHKAVTLTYRGEKLLITDGPFTETKEILGGILELEVDSFEEAVELMKKHPGVKMGPFEIRATTPLPEPIPLSDEEQIRSVIADWARALKARDVEKMMSHYCEDALLFDCCPPYKVQGRANIAQVWEKSLPFFPETFDTEHRDLQVHVDGSCAFVHGLFRFLPEPADHPCGESWMRISVGYTKLAGVWKVVHDHISTPFDPITGKTWNIKDPDVLDMPDYSALSCAAGGEG